MIQEKTDPWSADERENLRKMGARLAEIEVEVDTLEKIEASRAIDDQPRDQGTRAGTDPEQGNAQRTAGDPTPGGPSDMTDDAVMQRARATAQRGGWGQAIDEYMDAGFRSALSELVIRGPGGLSDASRAFLSEDATSGGYLVPPMPLVMMLIEEQRNNVFIEELSDVATISGLRGHTIPRLDSRPSDPEWTSETPAAGSADTAMSFGRLRYEPRPMRGILAEFSADEIEKDEIDIEATWRDNLQYLVGIKKENAYLNGDGVNKPVGMFVAHDDGIPSSRDVNSGGSAAITYQGLVNALYHLKEQYQMRSTWIFGRKAMAQIVGLQDNDGRPVWSSMSVGPGADFRGMILNRPYRLSEYVPNANKETDFAANDYVGILGDFRAGYRVLRTTYMRMIRDIYSKKDENIISIATRFYGDGKPKLSEPFARVKIGA